MEGVRFSAYFPVGIAGRRGTFTTFLMEAGSPALLRKGDAKSSEGKSDLSCDCSQLGKVGVQVLLEVNAAGSN